MGKDQEEPKKPSSLRDRVSRTRRTYRQKKNPYPMLVGAVVLLIFGVGLFVFLPKSGPRTSQRRPRRTAETTAPAAPAESAPPIQPVASKPKSVEEQAWDFTERAKFQARSDPDGALQKLKGKLGVWSKFPDLHHAMAMVVEAKIRKSGKTAGLAAEKLQYLKKAKAMLDAGSKWAYDRDGKKTQRLDASIEYAKKDAGK